ncbi:MAG: potassium channel protein [Chloroflexi bacterium]|nr:potassium channel protein [Chloroflexota bacterium]
MRVLTPWQRLAAGGGAAAVIWAIGIVGYMAIEGFSFLDAAYQTLTAVTTAGFGEINPLGDAGRIFTIIIIILGVTVILYVLTAVMQIAVEGELESLFGGRRTRSRIKAIKDHFILCGFGRVGEEIGREFTARGVDFVIVESNPEAIERAGQRGYLLLEGDATNDDILKKAGIERARCLLAASDSDASNTFIVLAAKAMNPDIFIVSRAGNPESEPRMHRAGAHRVFSPYIAAGRHMALSALQPILVGLVDMTVAAPESALLAEIEIAMDGGLAGRTIEEVLTTSPTIVVLAIQRASGELSVDPQRQAQLAVGDKLIVMGREDELEAIHPR